MKTQQGSRGIALHFL